MAIQGTVYFVTNPTEFFLPLVLSVGGRAPNSGFELCTNPVVAKLTIQSGLFGNEFSLTLTTNLNTANGTFEFNLPDIGIFDPQFAALSLSEHNLPIYRSEFFPYVDLQNELNIYLYQPPFPTSDGISAGQVSGVLAGHSLPGNTTLSASSAGLNVAGSESQINLKFGVQVIPDTSPNLGIYFDLILNGYNIHVGWPEDMCKSAGDILNSIKSGLQTAGSAANGVVQSQLTGILEATPFNLSSGEVSNLLQNVSIQFCQVLFPTNHSWPLSNTSDPAIVIWPVPVLGYPRAF
jgi:hypothetical protein